MWGGTWFRNWNGSWWGGAGGVYAPGFATSVHVGFQAGEAIARRTAAAAGSIISAFVTMSPGAVSLGSILLDPRSLATSLARAWRRRKDPFGAAGVEAPSVAGAFAAGSTLVVDPGTLPASAVLYQWLLQGATIQGATASTFTVRPGDVGRQLQCCITLITSSGPIPYAVDVV